MVNRDFLRFFQSLASDANIHPVAGGGDSGASSSSSCQVAPLERGAQNVVGEVQVEKKTKCWRCCEFLYGIPPSVPKRTPYPQSTCSWTIRACSETSKLR